MEDLFSYQLELLQKEMEMLQNSIRGYDSIVFTIKGWAITVFSGIVLFAIDKQKPFLYLFCMASVLAFWMTDAFYKSIQNILISRYRTIERFLQSSDFEQAMANRDFGSFQVPHLQAGFVFGKLRRFPLLLQAALQVHTFLPYVFLLVLAIGMFLIR